MTMTYSEWEKKAFDEATENLRSLVMYGHTQSFTMDADEAENSGSLLVELGENGTSYVHGIGGILPVPDTHTPYKD